MSNVIFCKFDGLKMLILLASTLIVIGRTNGQEDLLARIATEWKASEARFDSVRCKWKEDITYMPGSALFPMHPVITRLPAATPLRNELLWKGWPMEATNVSGERLVILKGNWMRNEEPILSFTPSDPQLVWQVTNKSSFDGEQAITLSVDGESVRFAKHRERENPDFISSTWSPVKAFVRPYSATRTGSMKIISKDETDKTVVVINESLKELTVALEQGCSIIAARQLHPRTGRVLWEYELNVAKDARQNWVPVDWTYRDLTQVSPQDFSVRRAAIVESFEYGLSLSKADFELPMPSDVTPR